MDLVSKAVPWPLPALLAWAGAWAVAFGGRAAGAPSGWEMAAGCAAGIAMAWPNAGLRRRLIAAGGFPVSVLLLNAGGPPVGPAVWLALLLPLLLLYPVRAWRDAPFFPTPAAALEGLEQLVQPRPARVHDAGCGLGHGLAALARLWPHAQCSGIEGSAPMAWLAACRLRRAQIKRGDMWAEPWAGFDLVYFFQRPESMARAWAKAQAEMAAGAWFVSLEFAVPGVAPHARLDAGVGRPVFVYRVQGAARSGAPSRSTTTARGR